MTFRSIRDLSHQKAEHASALFWQHATVIAWVIITLALLFATVTRLFPLFHYTHFFADQARDGFYLLEAKKGHMLGLGPATSFGTFALPPQYFYLVLPFAWFSNDPTYHLIPNVIASFAVVPVFGWLLWRYVFTSLKSAQRKLLAGLGMLWLAVHYQFYALANGSWNPNPLPLVILLMTWIILELWSQNDQAERLIKTTLLWLTLGLLIGLGMGLHGTSLFVFPAWLLAVSAYWVYRRRTWWMPILAWATAALTFVPYLRGELRNDFNNTRAIIEYVLSSSSPQSVLDRLDTISAILQQITAYSLFVNGSYLALASLLTVPMLLYLPLAWRISRPLVASLMLLCVLFLLVSTSYSGQIFMHYLYLGFLVPFFLCLVALGDTRSGWWVAGRWLLGAAVCVSIVLSLSTAYQYFHDELYADHSTTLKQRVELLQRIPDDARICPYYGQDMADLFYIDLAMRNDPHRYDSNCQAGDYVVFFYDPIHRPGIKDLDNKLQVIYQTDKYIIQRI